ncbi:MAG: dehydrogenase, partial [Bacteroidetes bacterium]|nr:dehydrogenase [Bacteroidota bacterium]
MMQMKHLVLLFLSASFFIVSCHNKTDEHKKISFENYKVENDFELQLAAAEPLLEAPIAMDFDNKGRIWVVEMRGFMPNLQGIGDSIPNGRVSFLEDTDHDGRADISK